MIAVWNTHLLTVRYIYAHRNPANDGQCHTRLRVSSEFQPLLKGYSEGIGDLQGKERCRDDRPREKGPFVVRDRLCVIHTYALPRMRLIV